MTVLFQDVHDKVDEKIKIGKLDHFPHTEILYADDTMIMGKRAREINIILHEIERESAKYNMKLNKGKCEHIDMNCKADIKFENGTKVKETLKAKYLGGTITKKAERIIEINNRLGIAMATVNKLKIFWGKCAAPKKWKLQVYNAIIIAQLIYGLNTMHMTDSAMNKLDSFHYKGLRRILKIDHAYFSRVSNEQIIEKANIIANKGSNLNITWNHFLGQNKSAKVKIRPISELIKKRQETLLGHIIRTDEDDPMRTVTLNSEGTRLTKTKKRVGRPRENWTYETANRKCIELTGEDLDWNNEEQMITIISDALMRNF